MHLGVNLSLKKANVRLGPEIGSDTMEMTRRIGLSQVNSIYDPLAYSYPSPSTKN